MKIRKTYTPCALLVCFFTLAAQNLPQKPFSPCTTDKPQRIFFHNDFKEALIMYSPPTKAVLANEKIPIEEAISQVIVQVNKKILEQGKNLEITPTKPLRISIKAPINTLIDYLTKTDLLGDIDLGIIKKLSTTLFQYTACMFSDKNPEQLYSENRKAITCAWLRTYRNTIGIFGATCEVKITLTPKRIIELVDDPSNPVIDFHDIFGEIAHSISEPSRWRSSGSYYNPVIQIL